MPPSILLIDAVRTDQSPSRTNWEAYYLAAHEELDKVLSLTTDQDIKNFLYAKLSETILTALAQCYEPDSNGQAKALAVLRKRCKERAMIEQPMTDTPHDCPPDDPPETQTSIGEWANATFGGSGDPLSSRHCIRLLEEVVELCLAAGASPSDIHLAIAQENRPGAHHSDWHASRPELAKVPEEMADCEIVLRVLAHRRDVDLQAEVDRKMKINRSRKWKLNNDGTGYHVKEGEE